MAVTGRRGAAGFALAALLAGCGRYDLAAPRADPAVVRAEAGGAPGTEAGIPTTEPDRPRRDRKESPSGAVAAGLGSTGGPASPEGEQDHRAGLPTLRVEPRRSAVVIGIDNYQGSGEDLEAAAADARLVRRALSRMGFGRIVVLINAAATRDAILWSARWLADRTGPRDIGAFFYAGHVRQAYGDPDGDGEDIDEAMLGADGRLVLDGEVAAALSGAVGPLWLAWAGCYAAGFADAAGPRRVSSYASEETSLAYESTALGHSFMVEYLVRRALLGEGLTRVEALHGYAWRHMRGDERRFRPLLDDRLAGPLQLAPPEPPPAAEEHPGARACLVVLRCS